MSIFCKIDNLLFCFLESFFMVDVPSKIDFLFSRGRNGLPENSKFGTNLLYLFIDQKNDHFLQMFWNG